MKEGFTTMAIIPQKTFFVWSEIEELGDLKRLKMVIESMPDEELMEILEKERGSKGRDDYPVRAMWNTILAGVVFQHISIESLRRELSRNAQLRFMCGLYGSGKKAVPTEWAYTRFFKKLLKHEEEIEEMFNKLVSQLAEVLPDFGKDLAIDSKAIDSLSNRENKNDKEDGRRDNDANWGKKKYSGIGEDGKPWEKIKKWFGYKLHLIVDANYELPVAFELTKASVSDVKEGHKLIEKLEENQPIIIQTCETMEADRGYDDTKLIVKLYDEYGIKPVIDIRNMWKDPDASRQLIGYDNIVYDFKGTVYCYCPETNTRREMSCGGFEKDRASLKKLCPAKHYGVECKGCDKCPVNHAIRIPLETDRRIFTPIDRASYKWDRQYNNRTSVERVNGRLDESFGFEKHYIRGMKKMKVRCGLALCVMLAMALARIKEKQEDKIRSLVA
jgi:transposase